MIEIIGAILICSFILYLIVGSIIYSYKVEKYSKTGYPADSIIEYGTTLLKVVKSNRHSNNYVGCSGCYFNDRTGCTKPKMNNLGPCYGRPDKTKIIYKKQ